MAVQPFVIYPHKALRTSCAPVEGITDEVRGIWQDMLDSMYAMPGVGLGANQIGVMKRLAVVDCSEGKNAPIRMANPEILYESAKLREHEEGSPNIPGLWAKISRPRAVTVRYMDETGAVVEKDFVNLWATSVQHQIDHLNGKLFIDHLKPVKRQMLLKKHEKNQKRKG